MGKRKEERMSAKLKLSLSTKEGSITFDGEIDDQTAIKITSALLLPVIRSYLPKGAEHSETETTDG